ncbi:MAG: 5-carboxymethyl-2-hydroxymuconate Delta-isomerase [Gammaproteobacteria bacterium]
MPHLTIEYSANLDGELDLPALIETLHTTAVGIDAFPLAGMRTRAARREHFRVADGHADNAFIHVTLKIGAGRDIETRKAAGETLFSTLNAFLQPLAERRPVAISFELTELDAETNYKGGNIRDYLAKRAG